MLNRSYVIILLWPTVNKSFGFLTDIYLKLEDVTRKFNKPCIMDVKIGQKSYDPYASAEKIQQQVSKYPLMEEIGFLVLGMRVRTCLHFQFMFRPLVSHQVQQLVFLVNNNPLEFYINTVLPECLGSAHISSYQSYEICPKTLLWFTTII